jgi:copper chaperone
VAPLCEQAADEALGDVAGVDGATADRDAERVDVDGDPDPDELAAAVEDAGYEASA